jgi:rod shape determining protein RodA
MTRQFSQMSGAYLDLSGAREASLTERFWSLSWPLVCIALAIACLGLLTLYSVAGGQTAPWMDRQAVRLVGGMALMLLLALLPLRFWLAVSWPVYVAAIALLAAVLLMGTSAMGARRWLQLGPLSLQPSELARVALVLALARYYQWLPRAQISHPLWVGLPVIAIVVPMALIVPQPDLGSGLLLAGSGLAVMFLAGVSLFYLLAGGVAAGIAAPVIWAHMKPYQRLRVTSFLDSEPDLLGAGYHIQQSKIALGSGGWTGKGFLNGTQSSLNFLPEKHTDFIFTAFGEEMGFVGCVLLLALYAVLLTWLAMMALQCRNQFGRLVIGGTAMTIFLSVFVNVGMVTGVLPVVGVPLPLMSYGGTSMLTTLACLGVAMAAYANRQQRIRPELLGFA